MKDGTMGSSHLGVLLELANEFWLMPTYGLQHTKMYDPFTPKMIHMSIFYNVCHLLLITWAIRIWCYIKGYHPFIVSLFLLITHSPLDKRTNVVRRNSYFVIHGSKRDNSDKTVFSRTYNEDKNAFGSNVRNKPYTHNGHQKWT